MRVDIYCGLKKWNLMREIAGRLCEFDPRNLQWAISYAYATRRSESIDAARNILINAMPKFPQESIIYYNLACYDAVVGDLRAAREYLKKAFEIDSNWRSQALGDEDLKPLCGITWEAE